VASTQVLLRSSWGNDMPVKSSIKPMGVQRKKVEVDIYPFDYKERILSQDLVEGAATSYLVNVFLRDMFPEPKGKNALFSWNDLTRNHAITFLSAFHTLNSLSNKDTVVTNQPYVNIGDMDIAKRVERSGIMTPKDIQKRYPVVSSPLRKK
jgi:hypothetical protein